MRSSKAYEAFKPDQDISFLYEGKLQPNMIYKGVDESSQSFIAAPKKTPTKVKPYDIEKTTLVLKIDVAGIFDSYNAPKGTEQLVASPRFYRNPNIFDHNNGWFPTTNWESTEIDDPYNFPVVNRPAAKDYLHPRSCECGKCGRDGGWHAYEPVLTPSSRLDDWRALMDSAGVKWQ